MFSKKLNNYIFVNINFFFKRSLYVIDVFLFDIDFLVIKDFDVLCCLHQYSFPLYCKTIYFE